MSRAVFMIRSVQALLDACLAQVTDHFCKLLASAEPAVPEADPDATERIFLKVAGLTVCTHSAEYADQVRGCAT